MVVTARPNIPSLFVFGTSDALVSGLGAAEPRRWVPVIKHGRRSV